MPTPPNDLVPHEKLAKVSGKEYGLDGNNPNFLPISTGYLVPKERATPLCLDRQKRHDTPSSMDSNSSINEEPSFKFTKNYIQVNGRSYIKLDVMGRGGSSKVYRVIAPNNQIYALKKVRLSRVDQQTTAGYINEIALVRKLDGNDRIIKLFDAEVNNDAGQLLMVSSMVLMVHFIKSNIFSYACISTVDGMRRNRLGTFAGKAAGKTAQCEFY